MRGFEVKETLKTALTKTDNVDVHTIDDLGDVDRRIDAVIEVANGVVKRVEHKKWTNNISWPIPKEIIRDVIENGVVIGKKSTYAGEQFEFLKDLIKNAENSNTIDFVWRLSPGPNAAANAQKLTKKMLEFIGESNSNMHGLLKYHINSLRNLEGGQSEIAKLRLVLNNVRNSLKVDLQAGGFGDMVQLASY